jgi:DNA-binding NarL/FixJ family response regulator
MAQRILVVDDEPRLLSAVAACLRNEGYDVDAARSAKDALVIMSKALPDLIVSDVRMPVVSGYQFAAHIRATPRTELIPIVFLTVKDQLQDRLEGFRLGVDAYLTKPFEPKELIAVVANILRRIDRTHVSIAGLVGTETAPIDIEFHDDALTAAEEWVAERVAEGLSNKEIAKLKNLSVRTVENHIRSILRKKRFSNRVEIARVVFEGRR